MPKLELVVISIKSDDYKFIKFGIKLHNPSKISRNQQLHPLKHMYKVQIVTFQIELKLCVASPPPYFLLKFLTSPMCESKKVIVNVVSSVNLTTY